MKNILLTGSSGFVGSRFVALHSDRRNLKTVSLQQVKPSAIDFTGIGVVLHCAGIAHRMEKTENQLYFSVNRDLTLELAREAKASGVKQFIFLSTIKVFGVDAAGEPLTIQTPCQPNEPYGQSKLDAEQGLGKLESEDFKVAIIRPPLIYGPGAKGNLLRLMQLVEKSKFLPLDNIHNQRSMLYVDNLVHLINCIIEKEAMGVFLPSDEPLSTSSLVKILRNELNPSLKLVGIPAFVQRIIGLVKPEVHKRLFGSLVVKQSAEDWERIGYKPAASSEEGMIAMARAYFDERRAQGKGRRVMS